MTLTFHLYHDGIEVAEPPIYRADSQRYKKDSEQKHSRLLAPKIPPHQNDILNTITPWSPLIAVTLLSAHSIYA